MFSERLDLALRFIPLQRRIHHPRHDASGLAAQEGHAGQGNSGRHKRKFLFNLSRSSYEKEWGTSYHRPGIRTRVVTSVVEIITKFGVFKSLAFRAPTPEVEKMFMASFNATIESYRALLVQVEAGHPDLPNENFDLGTASVAGQYAGADLAYNKLLGKLAENKFAGISPELRNNILDYYKDLRQPALRRCHKKQALTGRNCSRSGSSSNSSSRRRR